MSADQSGLTSPAPVPVAGTVPGTEALVRAQVHDLLARLRERGIPDAGDLGGTGETAIRDHCRRERVALDTGIAGVLARVKPDGTAGRSR